MQGLSQKDCERKLFELSPQSAVPREREREVSPTERELKLVVSEELYQKIERIRGLLAHAKPEASLAELMEYMADVAIEKLTRKKQGAQAARLAAEPDASSAKPTGSNSDLDTLIHAATAATADLPPGQRVHLPKLVQGTAWMRAGHRCEFVAPDGKRCGSRYRLELDHRVPLALGGSNHVENIRLLCRVHNAQQARLWKLEMTDRGY